MPISRDFVLKSSATLQSEKEFRQHSAPWLRRTVSRREVFGWMVGTGIPLSGLHVATDLLTPVNQSVHKAMKNRINLLYDPGPSK